MYLLSMRTTASRTRQPNRLTQTSLGAQGSCPIDEHLLQVRSLSVCRRRFSLVLVKVKRSSRPTWALLPTIWVELKMESRTVNAPICNYLIALTVLWHWLTALTVLSRGSSVIQAACSLPVWQASRPEILAISMPLAAVSCKPFCFRTYVWQDTTLLMLSQ